MIIILLLSFTLPSTSYIPDAVTTVPDAVTTVPDAVTTVPDAASNHVKPYNIFTIESNNSTMNLNINKKYTFSELTDFKLDYDINMYSYFTQSYFDRCHNYNTPVCEYNLTEQEYTCKELMKDSDYNNASYKMYYYGVYNDELHDYRINYDGSHYEVYKSNPSYEIQGVYVIQNSDLINNMKIPDYKLMTYIREPENFYLQMMLHLLISKDRITFCPYWVLRL
jgi:hypothetical protein